MVRRTKADAEATRHSLLDAAEHLFQARGVSRTSLNDIANAAGTTRGAIYWHFKDKADLFNAMMERVTLPLEETLACVGERAAVLEDPLLELRASLLDALYKTATDDQTRRVFEVATHQVEYNDEMHAVRERHLRVRNACMVRTAQGLEAAALKQSLSLPMPVQSAALGLHVIVDGLIQNWLLDPDAFDLQACGQRTVDAYLKGLGFSEIGARAPRRPASQPVTANPDAAQPATTGLRKPARSRKQTA
jgi:TetR/AcrR family transcriptional regulator, acrAB operon repressor